MEKMKICILQIFILFKMFEIMFRLSVNYQFYVIVMVQKKINTGE